MSENQKKTNQSYRDNYRFIDWESKAEDKKARRWKVKSPDPDCVNCYGVGYWLNPLDEVFTCNCTKED